MASHTELDHVVDKHCTLVYTFDSAPVRDLCINVALTDISIRLRATEPGTLQNSDYKKTLESARTVASQRAFLISKGVAWAQFPKDHHKALKQYRVNSAQYVWSLACGGFGIKAYRPDHFLAAPGEEPLTVDALIQRLPPQPFTRPHSIAELALLLQFMKTSGATEKKRIEQLLEVNQIPPYWVLFAAGGAGVPRRTIRSINRLAPLSGFLHDDLVDPMDDPARVEYCSAWTALINEPSLLGPVSAADMLISNFSNTAGGAIDIFGPTLKNRLADAFRSLGESGIELSHDQISRMRPELPALAGAFALAHYQNGRLSRRLTAGPALVESNSDYAVVAL